MTAFTTEEWAYKMLFTLKEAKGGFAGRIVNRNFHNNGGTEADAVKVINPDITVVGTATTTGTAMPTFQDANSSTITINLDTPIKYAVGLPWEMQLKTMHDVEKGYKLLCGDMIIQQRNALVQKAIDAEANIPIIAGTATTAGAVQITKDNVLDYLSQMLVQLMKVGAIMEDGHYSFVDLEEQENQAILNESQDPLDGEGQPVPGPIGEQVRRALPVCAVPADIYRLILRAHYEASGRTEAAEFYGHVPVVGGFEIVLDESLNHLNDTGEKYLKVIAGTRNLVTEAFTRSKAETIPDKDAYRDILRGLIVYGCKVTQPKCGVVGYFKLTA